MLEQADDCEQNSPIAQGSTDVEVLLSDNLLGADDEGPSEMPVPVTWAGRVMFACLLYLNRCGDGGKG